jgi:carbon monoxide dehydrogenase subunit G
MELSGNFTFDADQETVWNVLMDPNAIAKAIPGVSELVPLEGEENAWRAQARIGIASVSGAYAGIVRMGEQNPPHQYRLSVSGEGQQSIISGSALITLNHNPETRQTHLTWEAQANISGKLASIAQRVIKAAAGMLSKQFFNSIANQISAAGVTQETQT